jgi:transposase
MRQIREILRLKWVTGLTHREIARSCGTGAGTVSDYVRRARDAGLGWPLPEDLDDAALEARLFPPPAPGAGARPEPDLAHVHEELQRPGVTLHLLWEEYRQAQPDGYRYSQFCDRYRRWRKRLRPTMRQHHRAGERTFIDFSGKRPSIVDRRTGEVVPVELFVAVLGASSYTYAEACASQELPEWIGAHVRMSAFFDGVSEIWTPDNLRSGTTTPCRYEPMVNRTYAELAEHHGAVVIPTRVRKPRDKAKVESAVQVVQRWILARLRNQAFFSLEELNAAIRELLVELNDRPMRVLGKSRRELYESLDRPALRPLPARPYEPGTWKRCTANIDYHVDVEHRFYSVPYQLVGQEVEVRVTHATVEVFHRGHRVTSHQRLAERGRHVTKPEHMPSSHRAHAEWTPSRLIRWGKASGPAVGEMVERILAERPHPEMGFRAALGLIRLGKRHGAERLDAACRRALALRSHGYRTVKNILGSKVEQLPLPDSAEVRPRLSPHENVRGGAYYDTEDIQC